MRKSIRTLCKHLAETETEIDKWIDKDQEKVTAELFKRIGVKSDSKIKITDVLHEIAIVCTIELSPLLEDFDND